MAVASRAAAWLLVLLASASYIAAQSVTDQAVADAQCLATSDNLAAAQTIAQECSGLSPSGSTTGTAADITCPAGCARGFGQITRSCRDSLTGSDTLGQGWRYVFDACSVSYSGSSSSPSGSNTTDTTDAPTADDTPDTTDAPTADDTPDATDAPTADDTPDTTDAPAPSVVSVNDTPTAEPTSDATVVPVSGDSPSGTADTTDAPTNAPIDVEDGPTASPTEAPSNGAVQKAAPAGVLAVVALLAALA